MWLPPERAHLLSAAEVFRSILNIRSRSVTSEWEDTSLASWTGLREAYSSRAQVLQLVTCNLESFFSSFQIWVFLYTVLQFSVPFTLSVTLSSHGSQYPSTQGSAPLTLSSHLVAESGALGEISDTVLIPQTSQLPSAALAN